VSDRFLVIIDGDPVMVYEEYHWTQEDAKLVMSGLIKSMQFKMNVTTDPAKLEDYRSKIENIFIKKLMFN